MPEKLEPDDLPEDLVQPYALVKHERHNYYCDLFTRAMRFHWDQLCYIGLCTGSGRARVARSRQIVETSPVGALRAAEPFDKYIFCDRDETKLEYLKQRAEAVGHELDRDFDIEWICGDVNQKKDDIDAAVPPFGKGNTLLSFCFLDPFKTDVHFDTIRKLCRRRVDLLAVLMLGHDVRRNWPTYLAPGHKRIADWVGDPDWRDRLRESGEREPVRFLGRYFGQRLQEELGYLPIEDRDIVPFRNRMNVLQYWLAFYSKHERGLEFWRKTQAADEQQSLPL